MADASRVACVNAFSGASGDMFLGALVDLGVDAAGLESTLRTSALFSAVLFSAVC